MAGLVGPATLSGDPGHRHPIGADAGGGMHGRSLQTLSGHDDEGLGADDLDEFHVEDELFSGEHVVGVHEDHVGAHFHDHDRHGLAVLVPEAELHAGLQFHVGRHVLGGELDDGFFIAQAVGLLRGDLQRLPVAHAHAQDACVEAFDHLAGADGELQRVASGGGVELGSVQQTSRVVHAHFVAQRGVFCVKPNFSCCPKSLSLITMPSVM